MCKALEDLLAIEREKGEKLGIEQGIEQGIEEGRARERNFLLTLIPKMTAGGDGDKIAQLEDTKVLEAMQKKYGV